MKTQLPAVAALLLLTPLAVGQNAPAPTTASDPAKGDVVKLNVFEVRATEDDPYRASNTSAGTRYDAPLRELRAKETHLRFELRL